MLAPPSGMGNGRGDEERFRHLGCLRIACWHGSTYQWSSDSDELNGSEPETLHAMRESLWSAGVCLVGGGGGESSGAGEWGAEHGAGGDTD